MGIWSEGRRGVVGYVLYDTIFPVRSMGVSKDHLVFVYDVHLCGR